MIGSLFDTKIQVLLIWLSSFGFGAFFLENYPILGNFIGSIIATVVIRIINNRIKKKK